MISVAVAELRGTANFIATPKPPNYLFYSIEEPMQFNFPLIITYFIRQTNFSELATLSKMFNGAIHSFPRILFYPFEPRHLSVMIPDRNSLTMPIYFSPYIFHTILVDGNLEVLEPDFLALS